MRITIEIDSKREMNKLSAFLKAFNIDAINISHVRDDLSVVKGNKKIDPSSLFGMWKDEPRSIDEIRKASWQRKTDKK